MEQNKNDISGNSNVSPTSQNSNTQDNSTLELSSELLSLAQQSPETLLVQATSMLETMADFKELMMMYSCAIKEVRTKFEVLDTEFNTRYQRNPISSISSRLKSTHSIMDKISRKNIDFSLEEIEEKITDIAGIRIICSYVDDIFLIADAFINQDDVTLLVKKDYISNPKPNGYRSLHMIISIPVFFAKQTRHMKVEVQIRTIAMDFWASLEHQLKYKHDVPNQEQIVARLKACAETISQIDSEMMDLRKQLELSSDISVEENNIFDKLSKLIDPIL